MVGHRNITKARGYCLQIWSVLFFHSEILSVQQWRRQYIIAWKVFISLFTRGLCSSLLPDLIRPLRMQMVFGFITDADVTQHCRSNIAAR